MKKIITSEILAKRLLIALCFMFTLCCLKLCAEEVIISPAQAQVDREKFIAEAKKYVGSPYVYGAVGPDSFDCSGLIYFVARESIGKQMPRTAKALYSYCRIVPDKDKEIGDLLFFKTTSSGNISHVGIYIGNGQFISAISDGPNTGVIISSLRQDYWKDKYVAAGQFIKSGKQKQEFTDEEYVPEEKTEKKDNSTVAKAGTVDVSKMTFGEKLYNGLILDASVFCDWSMISPTSFMISFRGIDVHANCRYSFWKLQPGLGFVLRFNTGLGMFQMPILISSTINDYIRVYAGPVINFAEGTLIDTEKTIKGSTFPGILGCSVTTPAIKAGATKIQFAQDFSYTIFNNEDNSALSFVESVAAGFVLYTGVRVSFPVNAFKKSNETKVQKKAKTDNMQVETNNADI